MEDFKEGSGLIHLGDHGFENPRWGKCSVNIKSSNLIKITWFVGQYIPGYVYCSNFHMARAGMSPLEGDEETNEITVLKLDNEAEW